MVEAGFIETAGQTGGVSVVPVSPLLLLHAAVAKGFDKVVEVNTHRHRR